MSALNKQYWNDPKIDEHIALEEKIAQLSPVITYVYFPESNRIRFLNGKIKDVLGYGYHEIGLSELLTVIPAEDHDRVKNGIRKILELRDNDSCNFQCRFKNSDNAERFFKTSGTILTRDNDGNPTTILFVAQDITEIMNEKVNEEENANKAQQTLITELERSNRELEEFAYAAAHDLQEPLRKIFTFSERLRKKIGDSDDKEAAEYLDRILATTANMRTLLDSLLDFSKLVHAEPVFERTNMNHLLEEAKAEADLKLSEVNITFNNARLPVMDIIPTEMRQLFINLFSNAIKFRRPGAEPVITVMNERLSPDERERLNLPRSIQYIKISVEDNGIGFENEFAEKIFQPFQRLHGKTEYPGSGIGLAICRKIVEHHRGIIYAGSNPGKGATFTVILPERQLRAV